MLNLILSLFGGLFGGFLLVIVPKKKGFPRNCIVFIFSALSAVFSWRLAKMILAGGTVRIVRTLGMLELNLAPDPLGAIFGLIVSTLWIFASFYSFGYMKERNHLGIYYTFLLISLSMTMGVGFSGNLITLYIFYELLTLATYPLIIHERSPEALKAGSKYILYNLSGAGVILIGMIATYNLAGNKGFIDGPILSSCGGVNLNWLFLLFIVGFGVKAAIMPLHRWLPTAMLAPTPVSALLHAVAVVYSGVFGIIRVVYSVFGHNLVGQLKVAPMLNWIAAFTILAGVIVATQQNVLKRRLAYDTISQLSYILLGSFTLQPDGLAGALLHMISFSTLKITLFFCAGIISEKTGKTKVDELRGVGLSLPGTMTIFGMASMGMIGMLPFNTFWSKYNIMKGNMVGGKWFLALVLIISGLVNAICFIPILVNAFKGEKVSTNNVGGKRKTVFMLAPALFLLIIAVGMGIWPEAVWSNVNTVVDWFFNTF